MTFEGVDNLTIQSMRIGIASQLLGLLATGNVWSSPEERLLAEASLDYIRDTIKAKVTAGSDIRFPIGEA